LDEVAAELNVSRSQAYALVRDRSLLAIKIGGRGQWRIERCKLEDYIAQLYIVNTKENELKFLAEIEESRLTGELFDPHDNQP